MTEVQWERIFTEEHWIDRREVPVRLLEMIAEAARAYGNGETSGEPAGGERCADA